MTFVPRVMVANAQRDVGYHEGGNNWNPYSLWQYGVANNPWCDSAVCKWAYDAGYRFPTYSAWGAKGEMNVGVHHRHAVQEGIWRDRSYIASPGDLVVLNFGQEDQHIEMVLADAGGNVATIGGNTSDQVMYRTRFRYQIDGFIALTKSAQAQAGSPVQPKEVLHMGMTAGRVIPGSHPQKKAGHAWNGRYPNVAAINHSNGHADIVGYDGAAITGAIPFNGMSVYALVGGKRLTKPIKYVDMLFDEHGNWSGICVAVAEDMGTFAVRCHAEYV